MRSPQSRSSNRLTHGDIRTPSRGLCAQLSLAVLVGWVLLCNVASTQAQTGSILIAPDPQGAGCAVSMETDSQQQLYVLARNPGGITGAEFRLDGMPPFDPQGYVWTVTPNPASNIVLGDPTTAGVNIAFPTCQPEETTLLFTLNVFNFGDEGSYEIRAAAHSVPTNPTFVCPLVTLCDPPVFTKQCVNPGYFFINGVAGAKPQGPSPPHGATQVPRNTQLQVADWGSSPTCVLGIPYWSLHLGTTPDPPRIACSEQVYCPEVPRFTSPHDPGLLEPNTTYYWKVVHCPVSAHCMESDLWTFTTGASVVSVESATWTQLKQTYR